MNIIKKISTYFVNTLLIKSIKVIRELVKPKDITKNT